MIYVRKGGKIMYLKRIELHGFKSFADKISLELTPGITGIIGPNGCGKSNITDAIRWVLGEQSVKSMRGNSMSDVIFAGSQDRKAHNVAEVTLLFDNSDHYIKSEYDEIEITRRLYRHNHEAEYLLNKQPCRLKDIVEIMMDTGLGRDSLSMISQGNISSFADSKPEERRLMFEEAAGVAKYKKRKIESLRKLEKASDNLNRVVDIVNELEKQLAPLEKQMNKAKLYLQYKEQLKKIEVALNVVEIEALNQSFIELEDSIKELEVHELSYNTDISTLELNIQNITLTMNQIDEEVDHLQKEFLEVSEQERLLSVRVTEVDEKRKSILESNSAASIKEKVESIKQLTISAITEYNLMVDHYEKTTEELNKVIESKNKNAAMQKSTREKYESSMNSITELKTKAMILNDQLSSNNNYNYGVKTILNSSLEGIIDVMEKVVKPSPGYELAISTALGGASQFILTTNQYYARKAIQYLKQNKAGRATFLPIDHLSSRNVKDEHMLVCQSIKGYLGLAKEFIDYNPKYELVISNQLGNVIIAKDLESANEIANKTYYRYKVVTLQGDVSNVGGSMSGGSATKNNSSFMLQKELEEINHRLEKARSEAKRYREAYNTVENESTSINATYVQQKIAVSKEENEVTTKMNQINTLKAQYNALSKEKMEIDGLVSQESTSSLHEELKNTTLRKNEITFSIASKRETRLEYKNQIDALNDELKELRSVLKDAMSQLMDQRIQKTKIENELNSKITYLAQEYNMTFEYAKANTEPIHDQDVAKGEVFSIKTEIKKLGNVNLDSIEEYESISTRYQDLIKQKEDLEASSNMLLKAINEMDAQMTTQFDETFQKINIQFNEVFRTLFGGGKAFLKYTDPENILETGVDIDVQPPGKSIQNISLFSGGEKALIAISCLFAILKVRPVPLCILDEVEAALDQANVDRFAKFLKEFTNTTQFIVVTHRPGTMEQCDVLYGATMQQKGVTKLVSVMLEDALEDSNLGG